MLTGRRPRQATAVGDVLALTVLGGVAGGQLAVSVAYHAASGTRLSTCGGPVPVPRAGSLGAQAAQSILRHWASTRVGAP